jgi:hypothetical protein
MLKMSGAQIKKASTPLVKVKLIVMTVCQVVKPKRISKKKPSVWQISVAKNWPSKWRNVKLKKKL